MSWWRKPPAFFVRGAESVPCPCCQSTLEVIGSRPRIWIQDEGTTNHLIIRRLRCDSCGRIHHELPDVLVPYKRHGAAVIEKALEDPKAAEVAVESSTLRRWQEWFEHFRLYAAGCLASLARRFDLDPKGHCPPDFAPRTLKEHVGNAPGWLKRTVRPMANANLYPQTRSVFLSVKA